MIQIGKESSLSQAEIIYLCLCSIIGDGTDPRWNKLNLYFVVDATTVGEHSVYRIRRDDGDKVVWFGQNQVTDGLDVITAVGDQSEYIDKRGRIPKISASVTTFDYDQHYQAAKAILSFFLNGNIHTL